MSISIKKYVDITSGVGAGAAVKERELILRLFTKSPLVQAGTVMELTSPDDVVAKFGASSEEATRAVKYFGFISKLITKAKKISFAKYGDDSAAAAPSITGGTALTVIATWKAITDGTLTINVGSDSYELTGLDFSADAALADVATTIQTKLRTSLAGATVSYDETALHFNATFVGHSVPAAVNVVASTGGTDIADNMGWTAAKGAVFAPGTTATTLLDYVVDADKISDNYGSLAFVGDVSHDEYQSVAAWNNAQNVKYQHLVPVKRADANAWYGTLQTYSGTVLTIVEDDNVEHDEDIPGIILAATDYNVRNAGQNYMFQQIPGVTPKVVDDELAAILDGIRVNYYGQTMNAGQNISFYQDGYMCGTATAPTQMNVYANEQWLKAAVTADMLQFLLNMPIVPAADEGRSMVLAVLQDDVDRALFNGTIKVGKALNIDQKLYINEVTGDPLAWHQIQGIGYWMDATVVEEAQQNGTIKYIIDYTLLYSKADAVNKITGRHILV